MTQRLNLYIKLVPGVDDDLIQWLQAIPTRQRQATAKTLLREILQHQPPPDPLAGIRSELAAIRAMLAQGVQPAAPLVEAAPALSQTQLAARGRKLMQTEW